MEVPRHVEESVEAIRRSKSILIVTHHDADGASSAGVLARSLEALGKDYDVIVLRQLYPESLEELPLSEFDFVVFTDLGGRYVDQIKNYVEDFLVVDHHDRNALESPKVFHPAQMGYDPDTEASASTLSALLSFELIKDPKTLVYGLVGAAGDNQIQSGAFTGLNRVYVVRGVKAGLLTLYKDLALSGLRYKELPWVLLYSEPALPGLVGNEEAVYDLLERVGITARYPSGRVKYTDLDLDTRKRLVTALVLHLLRHGWSVGEAQSIIGEIYEVNGNVGWLSTIRGFKSLVNAVAKNRRPDIFVPLFLDRFEYLADAEEIYYRYRKSVVAAIRKAREIVEPVGSFAVVDGRKIVPYYASGAVASVLSSELNRPVVVFVSDEGGYVKASLRGRKGLSEVVEELLHGLDAEGGGHSEAAGFRIKEEDLDIVLERLASIKARD